MKLPPFCGSHTLHAACALQTVQRRDSRPSSTSGWDEKTGSVGSRWPSSALKTHFKLLMEALELLPQLQSSAPNVEENFDLFESQSSSTVEGCRSHSSVNYKTPVEGNSEPEWKWNKTHFTKMFRLNLFTGNEAAKQDPGFTPQTWCWCSDSSIGLICNHRMFAALLALWEGAWLRWVIVLFSAHRWVLRCEQMSGVSCAFVYSLKFCEDIAWTSGTEATEATEANEELKLCYSCHLRSPAQVTPQTDQSPGPKYNLNVTTSSRECAADHLTQVDMDALMVPFEWTWSLLQLFYSDWQNISKLHPVNSKLS